MALDLKSSDEILNELYTSLNICNIPKVELKKSPEIKQNSTLDSDNDHKNESNSNGKKSSKKKKKKMLKESKSKHKKKKKKKDCLIKEEENPKDLEKKRLNTLSKTLITDALKLTTDSVEQKDGQRYLSQSNAIKTLNTMSPQPSDSISRSLSKHRRSNSRSPSGHRLSYSRSWSKHRHSKSRSPSGHRLSYSRSWSKHRHSKSRSPSGHRLSYSRSWSKHRHSKSRSLSKQQNSRSHSRQRHSKSRSCSRLRYSRSPSRQRRSKSKSPYVYKQYKKKRDRSCSFSLSPPTKKRKSSYSMSDSPSKIEVKDPLDAWRIAKLASLKKINSDNNSASQTVISLSDEKLLVTPIKTLLENANSLLDIPIPGSTNTCTSSNKSSVSLIEKSISKDNTLDTSAALISTQNTVSIKEKLDVSNKATEGLNKHIEKHKDETKSKVIVIKSLKDSLVFQQAEALKNIKPLQSSEELLEELGISSVQEPVEKEDGTAGSINSPKETKENYAIDKMLEEQYNQNLENEDNRKSEEIDSPSCNRSSSKSKKSSRKSSRSSTSQHKSSSRKSRKRSRSSSRRRSRSRSRKKRSGSHHRRSRSRRSSSHSSRHRRSPYQSRKHARSRSKDRPRKKKQDCVDSLRSKATRKRLLDVARRNAVYLMKNNCLPPSIEKESLKVTGKSVEELTSFCKQLVATGDYSDQDLSDPSLSPEEGENQFDKPFSATRHPFAVKDSKPILMNIRNAPMLPTKTNAERLADTSKLREQFPVSSGSQHRNKAEGWVPVEKFEKEETVFPDNVMNQELDISSLVSTRLSAMRRLQDNPADRDAISALNSAQKEVQDWALSKQVPGQFTGSTGARVLSQEELSSGFQAWARKEQFKEAIPVSSHFGLKMLQKMGWNPGEGLGKNKEGQLEPLLLDVKMDKKGLTAQEELAPAKRCPIPLAKSLAGKGTSRNLQGKHPVSALVEICNKKKWGPPEFEIVFDGGPDHKKNFLMKVHVNAQVYKPAFAAPTKKLAKANAATACLQALGLVPKDPQPKAASTLHTTQGLPNSSGNIPQQAPPLPPPTAPLPPPTAPLPPLTAPLPPPSAPLPPPSAPLPPPSAPLPPPSAPLPPLPPLPEPHRFNPPPRMPQPPMAQQQIRYSPIYGAFHPTPLPPLTEGCQIPPFMNNQF